MKISFWGTVVIGSLLIGPVLVPIDNTVHIANGARTRIQSNSICHTLLLSAVWLVNMNALENDVLLSNDTGILGKRNSEFSQQESNLSPSDYWFSCSSVVERPN